MLVDNKNRNWVVKQLDWTRVVGVSGVLADPLEDGCGCAVDDSRDLALCNHVDVAGQGSGAGAACDEAFEERDLLGRWWVGGEAADVADVDRLVAESLDVLSLAAPAATCVDSVVSSDQEMIRNVGPAVGVDLEVVNFADGGRALSLRGARSCARRVNDEERRWADRQHRHEPRLASAPSVAWNDCRALSRHRGDKPDDDQQGNLESLCHCCTNLDRQQPNEAF